VPELRAPDQPVQDPIFNDAGIVSPHGPVLAYYSAPEELVVRVNGSRQSLRAQKVLQDLNARDTWHRENLDNYRRRCVYKTSRGKRFLINCKFHKAKLDVSKKSRRTLPCDAVIVEQHHSKSGAIIFYQVPAAGGTILRNGGIRPRPCALSEC
jgi:hypothetical protein